MKNKIYIYGATIRSKYDKDIHYVSAHEVARLYGINPRHKNVVIINSKTNTEGYRNLEGDIHLRPVYSGNYTLTDNLRERINKILEL